MRNNIDDLAMVIGYMTMAVGCAKLLAYILFKAT